jgi:RNA polymerase sigma-70 factor (ECF subfamily)
LNGLVIEQETQWTDLMRAGLRGDSEAYHRLLSELAPALRRMVKRGLGSSPLSGEDLEDVVQETLLALHLKRHTWDEQLPLLPWVRAIARNKMVDGLRRRGRTGIHLPIEDFSETLGDAGGETEGHAVDVANVIGRLNDRDREIVVAMSLNGVSARQVAERLGMTEGAVRVALHRALRSLAKTLRASRE